MHPPIRLAVLLSGSGTTLQNFVDRIASGGLRAEIVLVGSSKAGVGGLERARNAGIPTQVVERKSFASVDEFSQRLFALCREANADLVCLAGFLQLIHIPDDFRNRVMNIHPSLIPAFCGKGFYGHRVHEAVLASGTNITGCTVHFADNQFDHGPIILQRSVAVTPTDTAESLAAKVFEQECEAYPAAIQLFAAGRLLIDGKRVIIKAAP
jgi:phosphoribosylglycinamide formyltransferase 1